jgi:anaerobic selenocysteine-containing dehydrogenase
VAQGFAREDLFLCVHEQIMTETAKMADIVLPATMFLEHDDVYRAGGQQSLVVGPKLLEPYGECRTNHDVLCEIAKRVGAEHRYFDMAPREILDETLKKSNRGSFDDLVAGRWIDCQPDFETSHFLNGFETPDGKFHFKPDWKAFVVDGLGALGPADDIPAMPDHWPITNEVDQKHPFRLATSPSKGFLNSSFNETPGSLKREGTPHVMIHPEDAKMLDIADGGKIIMGNKQGKVILHAQVFVGVQRGVVICEGLFPNDKFEGGKGINILTSAEQVAPLGGAAFHDTHVWIKRA